MDAWQAVVQQVVEDGMTSGEFDADDAADVAWQLLGMIDGLDAHALVRWNDDRSRGSAPHRAVEGMLDFRASRSTAWQRARGEERRACRIPGGG